MDNSDAKKVENQILSGQNPASTPASAPVSTTAPAPTSTSNAAPASAEPQKSEPSTKEAPAEAKTAAASTTISNPKAASDSDAPASDVQFATANIDPKQQQYFEKVKITPDKKIKKALKDYQDYRNKPENQFHPFDEKHKKTTISIISGVVLITTATLITLALTVWRPNSENLKPASVKDGATSDDVNESARDILDSDKTGGYNKAIDYYEEQISIEKDDSKKFDLQRDYAVLIAENGDPPSAVDYLNNNVNPDSLIPQDKYSLYSTYSYLYSFYDSEAADYYIKKISEEGLDEILDD